MSNLITWYKNRQVRKTKETLAYWTALAHAYQQICRGNHYTSDEYDFAEAYAIQKKYEARLAHFEGEMAK